MVPDVLGRGASRSLRLPALFVIVTGLLLSALAWLAWRQIDVERRTEGDRRDQQLAAAAAGVVDDLERQFAAWERVVSDASGGSGGERTEVPAGTAILYFDDTGVTAAAGTPLPFYPVLPPSTEIVDHAIEAAESAEIIRRDLGAAESMYRGLLSSSEPGRRAAVLVRLARVLRAQAKWEPALAAYDALAALEDTRVLGVPADLVALQARSTVLRQTGDAAGSSRERDRLALALRDGRHRLDRATFEVLQASASPSLVADARSLELANAADAFWADWQTQSSGRRVRTVGDAVWISVWRPVAGRRGALLTSAGPVLANLSARATSLGIEVTMIEALDSATPADASTSRTVTRTAKETGLPWTLRVTTPGDGQVSLGVRSGVLVAGFALMTLVIAASGYFVFLAVNREVGVARLQADFLSAVSHEFRSPLTAMGHLTELLEEGAADPARVPDYYRALGRETRRLHGLVESLLDFGRTEAGGRTYTMTDVNLVSVVRDVVAGIEAADAGTGARVIVAAPSESVEASGDPSALAVVIRNLIDNALKYSPAPSPVGVTVGSSANRVRLVVEDSGPGLSAREQREVFRKFVRGAAARELNVKGTGIGLTMAQHIVVAHGGSITLDSAPGRGSRFIVDLPNRG